MADIFQEVDEALKQERVHKFWKENGAHLIAAVIIIIVGTAAINIYRAWDRNRNETHTAKIMQALEAENISGSLEQVAADVRSGQRAVALLMAAGGYVQEEQPGEALRVYGELAGSNKTPATLRHYAALMQHRLLLDMPEEQPSAGELYAMLEPMTRNADSPWHGHALLQAALTAAHVEGNYEHALNYLGRAAESAVVHESLKERARSLQHVYEIRLDQAEPKATEKPQG